MTNSFYRKNCFFYSLIFLFFLLFFGLMHPLVPFDTDDWMGMRIERGAYPSLDFWNPTKILPECLEPMVSMFASIVIAPLLGDFINAWIFCNAFTVSFFITCYLSLFHQLIEKKYRMSSITNYSIVIFFILLHFLIFRVSRQNNDYLWYAEDVNCYYHYIIPNMVSASLVMWFMNHKHLQSSNNLTIGLLILTTYLVLFSNLFCSIILIAFCSSLLLYNFIYYSKKKKGCLSLFITNYKYYILIICIWFFVQIMEVNGTRANSYGNLESSFLGSLTWTISEFLHNNYNNWFLILTLLTIILYYYHQYIINKKIFAIQTHTFIIFFSIIISCSYQILLCSRVNPLYIQRGDIMFSFLFYYLLITSFCLAWLCKNIKIIKIILPLILLVTLYEIQTKDNTYKDVQSKYNLTPNYCANFSRNTIAKIQETDKTGCDSLVIDVPKFNEPDNWPLVIGYGESVGFTLYKHGITNKKISTFFNIK